MDLFNINIIFMVLPIIKWLWSPWVKNGLNLQIVVKIKTENFDEDLQHIKLKSGKSGIINGDINIQDRTTKCLQKIIPDGNVEMIATSPLPDWQIKKFKQVCGNKDQFDMCINAIPENPEEKPLEVVKVMLQKKIDFLCGAGNNYYIHHKQCLVKNDVQKQVTTCSTDFAKKYDHSKKKIAVECSAITEFRDCVRKSAKICGADAQILVSQYMDFNVESYTGTPDCDNEPSGAPTNHLNLLNVVMLPAVTFWIKAL